MVFSKLIYLTYIPLNLREEKGFYTEKSVVVTAKLIFMTVKRLAGNERVDEGMSRNQPK